MTRSRIALGVPGLVLAAGLMSGCGGDQVANVPPPKPATAEEASKAAADVQAGMPKIAPPGAPAAPGAAKK